MNQLQEIGERAVIAKIETAKLSTIQKNKVLKDAAAALEANTDEILAANRQDVEDAHANGIREVMIDRLTLTEDRIRGMANGLRKVASLDDPIGAVGPMKKSMHPAQC